MTLSKLHSNRREYNWIIYKINDYWMDKLKNRYKGDLYDLGCGEMPYKNWLTKHCVNYIGVDWENSQHTNSPDIVADLNFPVPIANEVADTVVSFSVLEHLHDPKKYLEEAFRILKSGGYLVMQVPFMWGIHEAPHDYYRYTAFGLRRLLSSSRFEAIEIYPTTGFWVMWALKWNYQSKKLIRGPAVLQLLIRSILRGIWYVNQRFAFFLDKKWKDETETAGYFVVARKK